MGATREFLKQSTAAAHRRLDESSLVAQLAAGNLSPHAYQAMLGGYQVFFSCWESHVVRNHPDFASELGDFRFEKSSWLGEDVEKFGELPFELPPLADPVFPDDLPGMAGCLYVVEGSTLGGMHLSRSKRGLPPDAGRFFRGYGPETMPAWSAFIDWLEIHVSGETDRLRAAEAANEMFAWFQRTFDAIGEGAERQL
jgi:heme oxygenase